MGTVISFILICPGDEYTFSLGVFDAKGEHILKAGARPVFLYFSDLTLIEGGLTGLPTT